MTTYEWISITLSVVGMVAACLVFYFKLDAKNNSRHMANTRRADFQLGLLNEIRIRLGLPPRACPWLNGDGTEKL